MSQVEETMLGPENARFKASDHNVPSNYFARCKAILKDRWSFIQSDPHHLAYAVDPEFWHINIYGGFCDMSAVKRMAKRLLQFWDGGPGAMTRFTASFTDFRNKAGNYGDPALLVDAKALSPIAFHQMHGTNDPEFQYVAISALSIKGDNMDVERCFSIFKAVFNKSNLRMDPETAIKLAKVKFNSESIKRLKEGGKRQVHHGWFRDHLADSSFQ